VGKSPKERENNQYLVMEKKLKPQMDNQFQKLRKLKLRKVREL